AEELKRAFEDAGHSAEIISIPFKWYPPGKVLDHLLACRLLDVTEASGVKIDVMIGCRFPAFHIPHPNKVMWIVHQHRQAYDLWDHPEGDLKWHPDGAQARMSVLQADVSLLPEAKPLFTISRNVSERLKRYCGFHSTPLYHPPPRAEGFV